MSSRIPLPVAGALRLGRPPEIWFKPALSVVAAVAPPNLTLVALGRLDLAVYTMAGSLCALYAHNRPYAARARTLAWVLLGMLAGLAAALVASSLTDDAVVLVTVGALLAAVQKVLCDATRIGPPGHVILTFVSTAALFGPQTLGQIPGHLALGAAAGAWSWLVGMAPGLLRPHGPERRATGAALRAAATYAESRDDHDRALAATALTAARHALAGAGRATDARRALSRLVDRADLALAAPADADPDLLRDWARQVRGTRPVPLVDDRTLLRGEPVVRDPLWARVRPLGRIAARTALGCAFAGYASLALGVGRPYWALVTAASLYQASFTLTWGRGIQRVVGNLLGVLLFAALVPVAHLGGLALVLCCVALNFGAEALIGRNYWLGSVCVTPMALLITEFAGLQDPGRLIGERVLDTLVGALVGLLAAVAVPDRAGARVVRRAREAPRTLAGTGHREGPHHDQRTDSDTTEGVRP
ncbi:FUSC family protein [Streptomyces sp. KAU_LT]|uniref:FUSC family protein n=1 Tax=Streptomyces sp. KAU_LT TaxID=3046669 RepID=UPI0024B73B91|nr:FUSC family protein [Streptomyces sp. KAU_LT]MDI9833290.1 FUSC family protein [Streptomyces sp. KAU_LT]